MHQPLVKELDNEPWVVLSHLALQERPGCGAAHRCIHTTCYLVDIYMLGVDESTRFEFVYIKAGVAVRQGEAPYDTAMTSSHLFPLLSLGRRCLEARALTWH